MDALLSHAGGGDEANDTDVADSIRNLPLEHNGGSNPHILCQARHHSRPPYPRLPHPVGESSRIRHHLDVRHYELQLLGIANRIASPSRPPRKVEASSTNKSPWKDRHCDPDSKPNAREQQMVEFVNAPHASEIKLPLSSCPDDNNSGFFYMYHMDTYMGLGINGWKYKLKVRDRTQLSNLKEKYLYKIISTVPPNN